MALQEHTIKEIDLDEIIRKKAGSKSKYIPRFLVNWLKRIIHQEFINTYLPYRFKESIYRIFTSYIFPVRKLNQ